MNKTGEDLAVHAEEVLRESWLYGWGAVGQRIATIYNSLITGSYYRNEPGKKATLKAILDSGKNPQMVDCHGIADGCRMEIGEVITVNTSLDSSADLDFNYVKAHGKEGIDWGRILTLPKNTRGLGLWKPGHFGVYIGGGMSIDIYETGLPARKRAVSANNWQYWFKPRGFDFSTIAPTAPAPVVVSPVVPTPASNTLHSVGEHIVFSTCYGSSMDGVNQVIQVANMKQNHGVITKIAPGTNNPYLLENGMCWVNDGDIRGQYTVPVTAAPIPSAPVQVTQPAPVSSVCPYRTPTALYKYQVHFTGNDARWFQWHLKNAYLYKGTIDGLAYDDTWAAIEKAQERAHLGAGNAGSMTRAYIEKL